MADVVGIFTVIDGGALYFRRRSDDWLPDKWNIVSGHIEPGETPTEAAKREFKEEVGIDAEETKFIHISDFEDAVITPKGRVPLRVHLYTYINESLKLDKITVCEDEYVAKRVIPLNGIELVVASRDESGKDSPFTSTDIRVIKEQMNNIRALVVQTEHERSAEPVQGSALLKTKVP